LRGKFDNYSFAFFMARNRHGYSGFQNQGRENRGQEPKWVLKEVGEPIFGVRQKEWFDENRTGAFSNKDPKAFSQAYEANSAFREAKEKQRLLDGDCLETNFFKIFGEPKSIEVLGKEEKIALVYPLGKKVVSFYEVARSGYWEKQLIGNPAFTIKNNRVVCEVSFKGLPPAVKVEKEIAFFSEENERPRIVEELFSLLSPADQNRILDLLRDKLLTAEAAVEKEFSRFVASDTFVDNLSENRQKLVDLMSPGKIKKHSRYSRETINYGESDDGMLGPGSYETTVVKYFLAVGFKRDFLTGPICRKNFSISSADYEKEPEEILQGLIAGVKEKIKNDFLYEEERLSKDPDVRISRLEPGVWQNKYKKVWQNKQTEFLQNFYQGIQLEIDPLKERWQKFEQAQTEARLVGRSFDEAKKRAATNRVDCLDLYQNFDFPKEDDEPGVFIDKISGYQELVRQINQRVDEQLRTRNEVEIARGLEQERAVVALREAMETGIKPAPWFVFDGGYDQDYLIGKIEEATGRKKGQGIGLAVAGKKRMFLPGDQGLVGLDVRPRVNRYAVEDFKYFGLSPLVYDTLPISITKHSDPIMAKITDPDDWHITWVVKERGELSTYNLANKNGVASVSAGVLNKDGFRSTNWAGTEGNGSVTLAEILTVHGLVSGKSVSSWREETGRIQKLSAAAEAITAPIEKIVVLEVMPGARSAKCECGYANPIVGADRKKYQNGESVKIVCASCRGTGIIQK